MNYRQMQQLVERARAQFLPYEGVLGVGFGVKQVAGEVTETPAIVIYVERKVMADAVPAGEMIPTTIEGMATDVQEVRPSRTGGRDLVAEDQADVHEGDVMLQFLDWGKIHRLNVAQKRREGRLHPAEPSTDANHPAADLNTPVTEVRGNLFVIDDDGTLVYVTSAGEQIVDFVGAWNLFRAQFGDDYDFAVFFADNTDPNFPKAGPPGWLVNFNSSIYHDPSENGFGVGPVNYRASWNTNRLLSMVYHEFYSRQTMIHEIGHQWLFYINYRDSPTGSERPELHEGWDAGWSSVQKYFHPGRWLDNDRSCSDYDHDDWIQVLPGVYRTQKCADAQYNFCPLDQYLMGFLNPEAVSSSRVDPPTHPVSGGDVEIMTNPTLRPDGNFDASPISITTQNIVWNEGTRAPNHLNSQRVFHQAIIALTYDRVAHAQFLADSENWRLLHTDNWRRATSGRSIIDTSLLRGNAGQIYMRDNTADTGGSFPGGEFWDSPDLFVRLHDDDPNQFINPATPNYTIHEVPKSNQDNWLYTRVHNSSNANYENVVVNFYLGNYAGFSGHDTVAEAVPRTQFIYPIDWHPDALIGSVTLPLVPANGTAVAKVVWPQALVPPSAGWHPCLLVEILPLGVEPNKLHYCWENRKLAQKNLTVQHVPAEVHKLSLPFVFGHLAGPNTATFGTLEIRRDAAVPWQQVYLKLPATSGRLVEVNGMPHLKVAKFRELSDEALTALDRMMGGTILHLPGRAELLRQGYLPMEGFSLERTSRNVRLCMGPVKSARLPLVKARSGGREMLLDLETDGRELRQPARIQIIEHGDSAIPLGGITVELRPA